MKGPQVRDPLRRLRLERAGELAGRARWALARAWSASPRLTGGIVAAALVSGVLPAGLALTGRGLVDAAAAALAGDAAARGRATAWLAAGLSLALASALVRALDALLERRLRDELGYRVASDIIDHAATLDLASFEDPRFQDVLERARRGTADNVQRFLVALLQLATSGAQALSLFAILVVVEPLAVPVLLALALPYVAYQWRTARRFHELELSRTTRRRWSEYFLSSSIGREALGEVRLLALAPLLSDRFKTTLRGFIDQDRALHRRNFAGAAVFGAASTLAVYVLFSRVVSRALAESLSVGDVAVFGAAAMGLRNAVESAPCVVVGQNPIGNATVEKVAVAVSRKNTVCAETKYIDFAAYKKGGGYRLIAECLAGKHTREGMTRIMEDSGLRGLGGAGFPVGRKWKSVAGEPEPRLMAVNIDEGEPGTFKDRWYLERDPHRFLEGMLVAAWAVGIAEIYIYLRDEYAGCRKILEDELKKLNRPSRPGRMRTIDALMITQASRPTIGITMTRRMIHATGLMRATG